MKKVLILAYDFPPYGSIGAARPFSWYKYFRENGLYPVVVTRFWDPDLKNPVDTIKSSSQTTCTIEESSTGTIIRCPYTANYRDRLFLKYGNDKLKIHRKLISFIFSYLKFFCFRIDAASNIYHEAEKYIKNNEVSIVLATTEPFIMFRYASLLSKNYNIPWIADYRDGFSTNNMLKVQNSLSSRILGRLNKYLEKYILRNATAITAAAPSYISEIKNKLGIKINAEVIFNGFDEWYFDPGRIEKNDNAEILEIAYSGRLYPHHPVEDFFKIFNEIKSSAPRIKFKFCFYGLEFYPDDVKRIYKAAGDLSVDVEIYPMTGYNVYMNALAGSDLLVLFAQPHYDWLNAKLFDYLAVRKKILLFRNDHSILNEIITACNAGNSFDNDQDLSHFIKQICIGIENGKTIVQEVRNIENYSRKFQAAKMVKFLQTCVE